jgi:hypothetical protein
MSPTAPADSGSATADRRARRLTNSASVAAAGRAVYQRRSASWAWACSGTVRVRPRFEPRTTTSSGVWSQRHGAIAPRRRAAGWRPRSWRSASVRCASPARARSSRIARSLMPIVVRRSGRESSPERARGLTARWGRSCCGRRRLGRGRGVLVLELAATGDRRRQRGRVPRLRAREEHERRPLPHLAAVGPCAPLLVLVLMPDMLAPRPDGRTRDNRLYRDVWERCPASQHSRVFG